MALKLVQALDLQAFCDSSGKGAAAAAAEYAVSYVSRIWYAPGTVSSKGTVANIVDNGRRA